jgi:hypothetical protein
MTTKKTVTTCLVCRGELLLYEDQNDVFWAHTDKVLAETAGHAATPDPADIETIEVRD